MKKSNFLVPKYNMYVATIKRRKGKSYDSYKVLKWSVCPKVSLYYMLYTAVEKLNCHITGVMPNDDKHQGKYCHPHNPNASVIVGISEPWYDEFNLVLLYPDEKPKPTNKPSGLGYHGMYVDQKKLEFEIDKHRYYIIDKWLNDLKEQKLYNSFQFPDSHLWGTMSHLPKGYHLVRTGKTKAGDYYWDDGHWEKVECSYSGCKPGSKIEKSSIGYHTPKGSFKSYYYNDDIIRRNKKIEL